MYLAFVTVGSLIGTSAFFLFAGLIVLFIAFVVIRIEKRMKANRRPWHERIFEQQAAFGRPYRTRQSGVLYSMIESRATILRDGREIVLATEPLIRVTSCAVISSFWVIRFRVSIRR